MKKWKTFSDLLKVVEDDGDLLWQERAKLEYAQDIHALMQRKGISRTDLAGRLGTSQANVTQALRGDRNLQIETMVSMARAVGGTLHIRVHDQAHHAHFRVCVPGGKKSGFAMHDGLHRADLEVRHEQADAVA